MESGTFEAVDVPISLPSEPPLPQQSLWDRFLTALRTKDMEFEALSSNSNWQAILTELGFSPIESGRLLQLIEEKLAKTTAPKQVLLARKIGVVLDTLLLSRECRAWFATVAIFSGIIIITGGTIKLNTVPKAWTPYIEEITEMAQTLGWFISFVAGLCTMLTLYGTWTGARVTYYKNKFAFDWISTILGVYIILMSRLAHVLNSPTFKNAPMEEVVLQAAFAYVFFFCFMYGLLIGEAICSFVERQAWNGRNTAAAGATDQWWVRPSRSMEGMRYTLLLAAACVVGFGFGYPLAYLEIMCWMGILFCLGCVIIVVLSDVTVREDPDAQVKVCAEPRPLFGYGFIYIVGVYALLFILAIWGAAASDGATVSIFTWLLGFALARPLGGLAFRWLLLRQEQRLRNNQPSSWEDTVIVVMNSAQILVGLVGSTALKPGWTFLLGVICGCLIGSGTETVLGSLSAQHPSFVQNSRYRGFNKRFCPQIMRTIQRAIEVLVFFIFPVLAVITFAAMATAASSAALLAFFFQGPILFLVGFGVVYGHRKFLMPTKMAAVESSDTSKNALGSPLLTEASDSDQASFQSLPSSSEVLRIARSTFILTSTFDLVVCCQVLMSTAQATGTTSLELSNFLRVMYSVCLGILAANTRITYKALDMTQEIDPSTGATKQATNTALNFWFGAWFSIMLSAYRNS